MWNGVRATGYMWNLREYGMGIVGRGANGPLDVLEDPIHRAHSLDRRVALTSDIAARRCSFDLSEWPIGTFWGLICRVRDEADADPPGHAF